VASADAPVDPGWIRLTASVPVLSTDKARTELGWHPTRSAADVLRELLDGLRSDAHFATPPLDARRLWTDATRAPGLVMRASDRNARVIDGNDLVRRRSRRWRAVAERVATELVTSVRGEQLDRSDPATTRSGSTSSPLTDCRTQAPDADAMFQDKRDGSVKVLFTA
jgi:hypothetical protein